MRSKNQSAKRKSAQRSVTALKNASVNRSDANVDLLLIYTERGHEMIQKPNTEVNRLLKLRDKALALNVGGQVMQAEAMLDKIFPGWRILVDESGAISPMFVGAFVIIGA